MTLRNRLAIFSDNVSQGNTNGPLDGGEVIYHACIPVVPFALVLDLAWFSLLADDVSLIGLLIPDQVLPR